MPIFNVLYIQEFDANVLKSSNEESDHRIIILYDESENNFYYYGTRSRESSLNEKYKYIEYSGSYSYDAFDNFHDFLRYLLDGERSLITNELYHIDIDKNEYLQLSFSKLKAKCNKRSLLSAYDFQPNTGSYLTTLLKMLISN